MRVIMRDVFDKGKMNEFLKVRLLWQQLVNCRSTNSGQRVSCLEPLWNSTAHCVLLRNVPLNRIRAWIQKKI